MRWAKRLECIWEEEMHTGFWWGELREAAHLEDPSADGKVTLNLIFKNWRRGMD
jgi:hypothetical protein